jgi:translation elongation factor EF-1beta
MGGAAPAAPAAKAAAPAAKPAAKPKADDFDDLFGDDDDAPAPKAAAKKDDFDNLFDDDEGETEEEKAANKARRERMEKARKLKEEADAKAGKVKKEKEKAIEKSLIVLDVKPWEADTDLKMVWEKIKEYQQEGLQWGATYKLEPVAYGIKKLVMTCTIVDSLGELREPFLFLFFFALISAYNYTVYTLFLPI